MTIFSKQYILTDHDRLMIHDNLSDLDLMVIRAGGRTERELAALFKMEPGISFHCRLCGHLADALKRIAARLEVAARRTVEPTGDVSVGLAHA